jgi:hypothetical protein
VDFWTVCVLLSDATQKLPLVKVLNDFCIFFFLERLRDGAARERRKSKEHGKEKGRERLKEEYREREAKRLKEFLEDYDDERDDAKYYK